MSNYKKVKKMKTVKNLKTVAVLLAIATTATLVSCNSPQDKQAIQSAGADKVQEQMLHGRAMEAVVWGMPAVNYDRMYQAFLKAGAKDNQLVHWSRPSDWKNQLLTPNTDAIYFMPFFNTKEAGPVVLEIPAATGGTIVGSIMDCWQKALEDVGPAGVDAGKGGKYLILPPGYKEKIPAGYIALPSDNYKGYALLRSIPGTNSEADVAKAVAYAKQIKLYPLKASGSQTVFVDVTNDVFDATIPYDLEFFRSLDRIVQSEPWLSRDRAMIDLLKTVGIEKGKTFAPSAEKEKLLLAALSDGHQWIDKLYEAIPRYYEGTQWFLPASHELFQSWSNGFTTENSYPVDERGVNYYWGFSSLRRTGAGQHQLYIFAALGKDGKPLDGAKTYKLHVPANVPVSQYWSVTAYDRSTHALIRDVTASNRSSLSTGLAKNADGSVDLYLAPKAPAGKESNWIPTREGVNTEIILRFFGVEKPIIDKTWKIGDFEEVK